MGMVGSNNGKIPARPAAAGPGPGRRAPELQKSPSELLRRGFFANGADGRPRRYRRTTRCVTVPVGVVARRV